MDIRLRDDLPAGVSHEQRIAVARELAARIVARHGPAVAAIAIYGTTSINADGPYSDLDMTISVRSATPPSPATGRRSSTRPVDSPTTSAAACACSMTRPT